MKHSFVTTVVILASCVATGCLVKSTHRFTSQQESLSVPGLEGRWMPMAFGPGKDNDRDMGGSPWVFRDSDIQVSGIEKGSRDAVLDAFYFRIKGVLLVDLTAGKPAKENGVNEWWLMHVVPVHTLCRLEIDDDDMVLTPLDYDRIKQLARSDEDALPFVKLEDDDLLFTATGKQWKRFLAKHIGDPRLFNGTFAMTFERVATNDVATTSTNRPTGASL